MLGNASATVAVEYGVDRRLEIDIPSGKLSMFIDSPANVEDVAAELGRALESPLDFPPLARAVVPGDHVVIALDRHTPEGETLLSETIFVLLAHGVQPEDIVVLQPTAITGTLLSDPRAKLPTEIRQQVAWRIHDATDPSKLAYLAATASGERVYLARELVEADLVISIGEIAYDTVLGFRGTSSVLFPGMSSTAAIVKARGFGHQELDPEHDRPLRQFVDEVAWLLGCQFSIQVLSGRGRGVSRILAGFDQSVLKQGMAILTENRQVKIDQRIQTVVVAFEADEAGHSWEQLGAACATARSLVERGGKVVVLSELSCLAENLSDGLRMLQGTRHPREVLKPLRDASPPDFLAATQIAQLADWAEIYLFSKMDPSLVDSLLMNPLDSEREVIRLIANCQQCAIIAGAQHTYGKLQLPVQA